MRYNVDWNVFMRRMTVIIKSMAKIFPLNEVGLTCDGHIYNSWTAWITSLHVGVHIYLDFDQIINCGAGPRLSRGCSRNYLLSQSQMSIYVLIYISMQYIINTYKAYQESEDTSRVGR
jgi:hypothetical protein